MQHIPVLPKDKQLELLNHLCCLLALAAINYRESLTSLLEFHDDLYSRYSIGIPIGFGFEKHVRYPRPASLTCCLEKS